MQRLIIDLLSLFLQAFGSLDSLSSGGVAVFRGLRVRAPQGPQTLRFEGAAPGLGRQLAPAQVMMKLETQF